MDTAVGPRPGSGRGGREAEDLRVRRTVAAIRSAFTDLLAETDPENITVAALCERAVVHRSTFYRHYPTVTDLLKETLDLYNRAYLARVEHLRLPGDLAAINAEFFRFALGNGPAYERLVCHPRCSAWGREMLLDLVRSTWRTAPLFERLEDGSREILLSYLHSVGTSLYCQWLHDGRSMTLDEVIELSTTLLCRGVEGFVELTDRRGR